jgi:septal ring-binding cell division protein DamX
MSTNDSPWGDTGFDANDDGFMKSSPKGDPSSTSNVPTSASEDHVADRSVEEAHAERVRVEPVSAMPPIAPPPTTRKRNRSLLWIAVIAVLMLAVAVIGVEYYLSSRSIEEQAFVASDAPTETPAENLSEQAAEPPAEPTTEPAAPTTDTVAVPDRTVVQQQASVTPTAVSQPTAANATQNTVSPRQKSRSEPSTISTPQMDTKKASSTTVGAAWVVQVFASPSRDDADEWLQQLREQRITDGYIVEQKVKGQSWYRVRFGQFATRAEAEEAAKNRGYAQPWVARVR